MLKCFSRVVDLSGSCLRPGYGVLMSMASWIVEKSPVNHVDVIVIESSPRNCTHIEGLLYQKIDRVTTRVVF